MELLDSTEKLMETQSQNTKLQTSLDNVMKEKVQRHFMALCDFNTDFLYCWSYWNIHKHYISFLWGLLACVFVFIC